MHLEFSTNAVARRNVINKDFLLQEQRQDASVVIRMVSKNVSVSGYLIRSSHASGVLKSTRDTELVRGILGLSNPRNAKTGYDFDLMSTY
eukprot:scaffold7123_cov161-Skeletonema_marinoi.AAC.10